MSRRRHAIACGSILVLVLGAPAVVARAEEPAAPRGIVIYRDPTTGRLGAPPSGVVPPTPGVPRQPGPVVENPGTTRAGGWKASARLKHTMRATVATDGAVAVDCVPGTN